MHRDNLSLELAAERISYAWRQRGFSVPALVEFSSRFSSESPSVICGPSGAGKSTAGLILSGLLQADKGSVLLNGIEIHQACNKVAYVFQFPENLFFEESVREEFAQLTPANDESTRHFLQEIGINFEEIADLSPFQLSGGYSRLIALALQMVRNPEVLIVDEPTVGLDWKFHERISRLLETRSTPQRILIAITHDLPLMKRLGGRSLVLAHGRITWEGATEDLLADSRLCEHYGLQG